eukprot:g7373.t1
MLDMEMDLGERQEMEMNPETGDLDVAHEIDLVHDAAGGNENDSILLSAGGRAANTTRGKKMKKKSLAGGPYTTARELSGADEDEEADEVFSDEYLHPPGMKLKRQNSDPTPVRRRGDSFYTPLRCWGTPDDDEIPAAWSRLEGVEGPPQEPPDDSDSSSWTVSGDESVLDLLLAPPLYSRHGTRHRRDRRSPAALVVPCRAGVLEGENDLAKEVFREGGTGKVEEDDECSVRYVLSELAKVYQAPRHKNVRYAVVEDLPGASSSSPSSRGVGAPDDHGLGPAHRVSLLPDSEEARRLAAEGYVPKFVEASDLVHFSDVCFPKFAADQGLRRSGVVPGVRFLVQKSVEPAELARTLPDLDLAGLTVTRETDSTRRRPGTSQDDSHLTPAMAPAFSFARQWQRIIEQENKTKAVVAAGG